MYDSSDRSSDIFVDWPKPSHFFWITSYLAYDNDYRRLLYHVNMERLSVTVDMILFRGPSRYCWHVFICSILWVFDGSVPCKQYLRYLFLFLSIFCISPHHQGGMTEWISFLLATTWVNSNKFRLSMLFQH